eukprot:TRINITY_DN79208_c0_g1_i1.p1 TRINITY_DN79208_c0_g1~~TRINITY_DN79208_c0_g1_i1.p1  ORF type:complete len:162 (+),score=6.51 TRINITY_DN79208_c0_g1_i1:88-573(+)
MEDVTPHLHSLKVKQPPFQPPQTEQSADDEAPLLSVNQDSSSVPPSSTQFQVVQPQEAKWDHDTIALGILFIVGLCFPVLLICVCLLGKEKPCFANWPRRKVIVMLASVFCCQAVLVICSTLMVTMMFSGLLSDPLFSCPIGKHGAVHCGERYIYGSVKAT